MNTAGRYIGTDPVGEGGDIHAGQDEEHQAGHGGYYEFVAWGGLPISGGGGGGEDGKTMWART